MSTLASDQLAQNLQQTNYRLGLWLDSLAPGHPQASSALPQLMSRLLSELLQAGEWLRGGLPEQREPWLDAELCAYRRNLERLRDWMPAIHRQLLAERSRLEAERLRIESAVQWAESSRQTL